MSQMITVNLKQSQVRELLKLEELFHSQYMTQELLNEMIGLYVKFVQNIHANQHPLRLFFMEKIKYVLSRPEIIRILEKDCTDNKRNMRDTIRGVMGLSVDEEIEMKKLTQQAKKEIQQNHIINMKKDRGFAENPDQNELRQKERNMKIEMQMKIMEEVQSNMRQMKNQMNMEGQNRKKKEEEITNMVQKQDNALNERLAKRKKKLRKKSVQFKDKEVIELEPAPPIAKAELIAMKKEVSQTYERFTRLTMNKTKRGTQSGRENEGKVKVKMAESPIYEEDFFDELDKKENEKKEDPTGFKKKRVQEPKPDPKKESPKEEKKEKKKEENNKEEKEEDQKKKEEEKKETEKKEEDKKKEGGRNVDSSIEYKTFDQKQGRVTVRNKVYEEIEDDEAF